MTNTTRCINLQGQEILVDVQSLEYRPASYVFLVHNGKLLTFSDGFSKTRMIPGGKIELGETAIAGLCRETLEEVGMFIEDVQPLCFAEAFLYAENEQQAYQAYAFFFVARPRLQDGKIVFHADAETRDLKWIPVNDIHPEEFHRTAVDSVRIFLKQTGNHV